MNIQVRPAPFTEALITILGWMFLAMIGLFIAAGTKYAWRLLVG